MQKKVWPVRISRLSRNLQTATTPRRIGGGIKGGRKKVIKEYDEQICTRWQQKEGRSRVSPLMRVSRKGGTVKEKGKGQRGKMDIKKAKKTGEKHWGKGMWGTSSPFEAKNVRHGGKGNVWERTTEGGF